MILSVEETNELLGRDDMRVFPSLYAISEYETELYMSAYDLMVQTIYNL